MSYIREINPLRDEINRLNTEIIEKLKERVTVAIEIGEVKKRHGKPVVDKSREEIVLDNVANLASEMGLDPEATRRVFRKIIDMCVQAEE
ncbi:MAG: chorismate mutase [Candidatus Bathyarchaeota archaeon]|nr:chorismate mutase [Candidatus Bathyarchaeota archaeon]